MKYYASIAAFIINGGEVKHDDKLRGQFSETLYQIDVHQIIDGTSTMGEAKDYSDRNSKVGRGDLQKLGGALPDLKEVDSGMFFSATGYTKPAKRYAEASEKMTGKPINLYELRPSTELDVQGLIKTIIINIRFSIPMLDQAIWRPHITEKGQQSLRSLLKNGEDSHSYELKLDRFYNVNGEIILSVQELTSKNPREVNNETQKEQGCYILKDHYIKINGVLAEIKGLEYEIPYSFETREIRITDDSQHRFILHDSSGNVLKVLTDKRIREIAPLIKK